MSDKTEFRAMSLDDLADVVVDVPVERPDGTTVIVPLKALSEGAVFTRRQQIDWPTPPATDFEKIAGKVTPKYDYQDAAYLKAVRAANRRLTALLMLDSLPFPVAGANDDERITTLHNRMGQFAFTQLVEASNRLNTVTEDQIATMARSFRAGGAAGTGHGPALGTDAGAVAAAEPG